MLSDSEMIRRLQEGEIQLPPLEFRVIEMESRSGRYIFDATIQALWSGEKIGQFAVELKPTSTPKVIQNAMDKVRRWRSDSDLEPMIIVPFLSEERLKELEEERISGIDLCGNGIVIIEGRLLVYRTGSPNQFKSTSSIKNIYRKKTSLVPRMFLAKPRFQAVQEILGEIQLRDRLALNWEAKEMSLPTVSKALKAMGDDLLIQRKDGIRLVQPKKLLDLLAENYDSPKSANRIRLKLPVDDFQVLERVREEASRLSMPWVATGLSSVARYAVMQRGEMTSVYCPQVRYLLQALEGKETSRFPNLELIECDDERVYFNSIEEDGYCWADATQTYLELMAGDKRDRETAEQVKTYILDNCERTL
jgi:hypothetical protein